MSNDTLGRNNRLRGRAIFLSASVPDPQRAEKFRRVPEAHIEIDEAVVSLARAVISEGGRIVYGGHPSISRLIAMVAGEYLPPRHAEKRESQFASMDHKLDSDQPPIIIYQSRLFEKVVPHSTMMLFKLGYAKIVWVDSVGGERFEDAPDRTKPRFPQSLREMRVRMIKDSDPMAMVCIGGMEGIIEEVDLFQELNPKAPIYLIAATGGAAALLSEQPAERMFAIDKKVQHRLKMKRKDFISTSNKDSERRRTTENGKPQDERRLIPYSLIMQEIVSELLHRMG